VKISAAGVTLFAALCLFAQAVAGFAHELSGYVSAEGRFFFNDPASSEQERDNGSFAFQPEYYSLVGIADTDMDLGLIGEYAYDERGDDATTVYENDAMLGLRLAVNDADGTELLAGLVQDLDSRASALSIEASRRLGSNWKLSMQAWGFLDSPVDDLSFNVRDDDFVQVELAYYF